MRARSLLLRFFFLVLGAALLAGCGGDDLAEQLDAQRRALGPACDSYCENICRCEGIECPGLYSCFRPPCNGCQGNCRGDGESAIRESLECITSFVEDLNDMSTWPCTRPEPVEAACWADIGSPPGWG